MNDRKKKKQQSKEPPMEFVECPECGAEQADMGRNVRCESCGWGPMPTNAPGLSRG